MASLISRNLSLAGKIMSRSVQSGPYAFKTARNFNLRSGLEMSNSRSLVLSRGFADSKPSGGDHLKDGLPEQYQWTAQHLETYLRNFANKHGFKQADVDHLIKTFVTGSTSASEFFKLDREALAAKIGKDNPDRTKMANLLVAEVWKETEAVGRKMQNFGSIIIGVAALVFGGWAVTHFMGDDSKKDAKKDVKNAAHDAKKDVKSVAHDAKESIKDGAKSAATTVKNAAHDAKESAKGAIHDAKSSMTNAKDSAKSAAHDAKDSAKNAAHDAKDSVKNAAHDAKNAASNAKDSAKNAAHDAKKDVKDAAKDIKETAKNNKDDAKAKTAQAFKDDGAVGKQFTEKGAIGGTAQKIGGPLDKDGAIGKQFTKDGAIGGAVQKKAEEKDAEYSKKQEEYYKNKK